MAIGRPRSVIRSQPRMLLQAPTESRSKSVEKQNERFDLPPSQEKVTSACGLESEENLLAKTIEQENIRLDRELRGICGGCRAFNELVL
jgi:hypothetical protein